MTEDEAKTKTCCGSLPVMIGVLMTTNPSSKPPHASCIGSACMAWRWEPKVVVAGERLPTLHGWCGLAGAQKGKP